MAVKNLFCDTAEAYADVEGVFPFLYSIRDCIPLAFPSVTLVIFGLLLSGNYFITQNKTQKARILESLVASSFVTTILSIFLMLSMLVTLTTVMFWALLTITSFIILMLADNT